MKDTGKYEAYEKMISYRDKAEDINIWGDAQVMLVATYEQKIEMEWAEYFFKGNIGKVYQDMKKTLKKIDIIKEYNEIRKLQADLQADFPNFVSQCLASVFPQSVRLHLNYLRQTCKNNDEKYKTALRIISETYSQKLQRLEYSELCTEETFDYVRISTTQPFNICTGAMEHARRKRQIKKAHGYKGLEKYSKELSRDSRNKAKVSQNGEKMRLQLHRNNTVGEETSIIFDNMDNFLNHATESMQKVCTFVLDKLMDYYDRDTGKLRQNTISFHATELIEAGIFKTIQGACDGFDKTMKALENIRMKYRKTIKVNSKKKTYGDFGDTEESNGTIFGRHMKKNGKLIVVIADSEFYEYKQDFSFFFSEYAYMPKAAYKLSNKSYLLCRYIYMRARQSADKISIQQLIQIMDLPHPEDTKNIDADIIGQIENAKVEIETVCSGAIELLWSKEIDEGQGKWSYQIENGALLFEITGKEKERLKAIKCKKEKIKEENIKKSQPKTSKQ